ncbi:MAG: tetratricopeptide repeat protein [Acidiferrobacteraceae bacterium]
MISRRMGIVVMLAALSGCHASGLTPAAEYQRGEAYAQGQNVQKAVYWFRKAAEQGYAPAENNMGGAYAEGASVPQNYQKAVHWYRKAAAQGYAPADYNMAFAYGYGWGVPQNNQKADHWSRKARLDDRLLNARR